MKVSGYVVFKESLKPAFSQIKQYFFLWPVYTKINFNIKICKCRAIYYENVLKRAKYLVLLSNHVFFLLKIHLEAVLLPDKSSSTDTELCQPSNENY